MLRERQNRESRFASCSRRYIMLGMNGRTTLQYDRRLSSALPRLIFVAAIGCSITGCTFLRSFDVSGFGQGRDASSTNPGSSSDNSRSRKYAYVAAGMLLAFIAYHAISSPSSEPSLKIAEPPRRPIEVKVCQCGWGECICESAFACYLKTPKGGGGVAKCYCAGNGPGRGCICTPYGHQYCISFPDWGTYVKCKGTAPACSCKGTQDRVRTDKLGPGLWQRCRCELECEKASTSVDGGCAQCATNLLGDCSEEPKKETSPDTSPLPDTTTITYWAPRKGLWALDTAASIITLGIWDVAKIAVDVAKGEYGDAAKEGVILGAEEGGKKVGERIAGEAGKKAAKVGGNVVHGAINMYDNIKKGLAEGEGKGKKK